MLNRVAVDSIIALNRGADPRADTPCSAFSSASIAVGTAGTAGTVLGTAFIAGTTGTAFETAYNAGRSHIFVSNSTPFAIAAGASL